MNTEKLVQDIAKLKGVIDKVKNPEAKAKFEKQLEQKEKELEEAQAESNKKEKTESAEENKKVAQAEEEIQKLERAIKVVTNPSAKEKLQKKLDELKGKVKEVKQEIKEEKKEVAGQKKAVSKAATEAKSPKKTVRKSAVKKVAAKKAQRKKTETKKTKRKSKINEILSGLDELIEKNKQLRAKYGSGYKGTGKPSSLERDAGRKAKPFGYRFVGKGDYRVPTQEQIKRGLKRGTIDYEARPNRADVGTAKKVKLEDGGLTGTAGMVEMKKRGGKIKVGSSAEDKARFAKPAGWRWKEEAFEKGIVTRAQLAKHPSKSMRQKYPDLVYYEDRLNKADKKPTRTSAASV